MKKSKGNYRTGFTDFENLRKIANFHGLDIEILHGEALFKEIINPLHESTSNLSKENLRFKYTNGSYNEVGLNGAAARREFDEELGSFEEQNGRTNWRSIGDNSLIQFDRFEEADSPQPPEAFEDFLAGDEPSIADETGDEYTDWGFHETEFWNDNIMLAYDVTLSGSIPVGREKEKYPVWSNIAITLDPETGEFREQLLNSQEGGGWEVDPVHDYQLDPEQLERYTFSY